MVQNTSQILGDYTNFRDTANLAAATQRLRWQAKR